MRRLFVVAIVLLAGIAGLGFYKGWFLFSSEKTNHKVEIRLTVDEQKLKADEEKLKDLGRKAKQSIDDRKDAAKAPARQP